MNIHPNGSAESSANAPAGTDAAAAAKNALRGTAGSNAPTILSVRGLDVEYKTGNGWMKAVRGVDLDIRQGEAVALIGESGSGKSTLGFALLRMLVRTARISGGSAIYREQSGREVDLIKLKDK
ncbi:MAG TPA: ATP-binding cassette domain-containing protein, partial [Thermomicrobiales bacterium]|nr:ATP-binding cassette domain-containing protein [Thermomicrobiales bacterium]